jgi:hypothetical protein
LINSFELNVSPIAPPSTFFFNCGYFTQTQTQTQILNQTQTHGLHGNQPKNRIKIAPTRQNPPDQFYTADQLPASIRRKAQPPTTSTEDTSDSETLSRLTTPPSEPTNESQTPIVRMAAKPMKPSAYDGKTRDARIVDAWLARMTTYLPCRTKE